MFKELLSIFTANDPLPGATENFYKMLELAQEMILEASAVYWGKEQSPEDQGRYESAEDEAKGRKWGLWAEPNPINPYEWRKGVR